jgi:membrane associated rhomboid family serine protease
MRLSLQLLAREWKECPATILLCAIWLAVFAGMAFVQLSDPRVITWKQWVYLGINDGYRFGDCTLDDLAHGQWWRLVTSTFVHYNFLHIGLNLLIMYQLGAVIESWYGSAQLVFLYLLTGGGGNAVSALIRHGIHAEPRIHWGGGSVVIMGLVALCCVVGWRNHTPMDRKLGRQSLFILVATGILGALLPRYVDNWGHAGGALLGLGLGFADHWLLNRISRPSAWGSGVLSAMVLIACGLMQYETDRRAGPSRLQQSLAAHVIELDRAALRLSAARQALIHDQTTDAAHMLVNNWNPPLTGPAHRELTEFQQRVATSAGHDLDSANRSRLLERTERLIRDIRREQVETQRRLRDLRARMPRVTNR